MKNTTEKQYFIESGYYSIDNKYNLSEDLHNHFRQMLCEYRIVVKYKVGDKAINYIERRKSRYNYNYLKYKNTTIFDKILVFIFLSFNKLKWEDPYKIYKNNRFENSYHCNLTFDECKQFIKKFIEHEYEEYCKDLIIRKETYTII